MTKLSWNRWRRDLVVGLVGVIASLAVCVPCSWAAIRRERERMQRNLLDEAVRTALQFGLAEDASAAEIFSVETDAITPEVPKGAHLLIDKQAPPKAAGDVVVYRRDDKTYLGRVLAMPNADGVYRIGRNGEPDRMVDGMDVVGRCVLNTR